MADINDLNLLEEEVPAIDWDAPEGGLFPPAVKPGVDTDFTFKLEENDPFSSVQREGKNFLNVAYQAVIDVDGQERTLRFQRANTHQADWMRKQRRQSSMIDLIRALGLKVEAPVTNAKLVDVLKTADAQRKHFHAACIWRAYCDHGNREDRSKAIEFTTRPFKQQKEGQATKYPWPRNAQGDHETAVECPVCKQGLRVNAEIDRFKLPKDGPEVHSSTGNGANGGVRI